MDHLLKQTKIILHPEPVAVIGLGPALRAEAAGLAGEEGFVSLVVLPGEVTLILAEKLWDHVASRFPGALVERDFALITLDITLTWDVVGYLASVTGLLAKEEISVGVISSFSSDHLLIGQDVLPPALAALQKLGMVFNSGENGK